MTVNTTVPSLSLSQQSSAICDPALTQALPRKQTDRDLGLIQPTAVRGGVVHRKPIPQPASGHFAKAFTTALRVCELRSSSTKWMVSASG